MLNQAMGYESPTGRRKASVMLVDDAPIFTKMAKLWLESFLGDEIDIVETAASGEECLAKAQEHAPEIILMDLHMPGMGGLATIPLVHILFPETRIIALSLIDDEHARNMVSSIGGAAFVSKADMKAELGPAIHRAIADRELEYDYLPAPI